MKQHQNNDQQARGMTRARLYISAGRAAVLLVDEYLQRLVDEKGFSTNLREFRVSRCCHYRRPYVLKTDVFGRLSDKWFSDVHLSCLPDASVKQSPLREMRKAKKLSQGDIEKRTRLPRADIFRVENGHTVPAIETLEKMARALEVPLYQLFYDGGEPPKLPNLLKGKTSAEIAWGSSDKDARFLGKLRRVLGKADEADRKIILLMA
jgi:transcriptional regulator with XRE-family HTH domain